MTTLPSPRTHWQWREESVAQPYTEEICANGADQSVEGFCGFDMGYSCSLTREGMERGMN